MKYCLFFVFVAVLVVTWNLLLVNALPKSTIESDECFDSFGERTTNAAHLYAESYENCQHHGKKRRASLTREKETERQQIENATAEICSSMEYCNKYEAHQDFFDCHAAASFDNMDTLISIHLNASAVAIDLSTQYEQAEKEVRLCTIEAQRNYTIETREALKELRICLER